MRRAVLWGVAAGVLAVAVWLIAAHSFFRPLLAVAPVVVYAVVLLVRVVMEPRSRTDLAIPLPVPPRSPRPAGPGLDVSDGIDTVTGPTMGTAMGPATGTAVGTAMGTASGPAMGLSAEQERGQVLER